MQHFFALCQMSGDVYLNNSSEQDILHNLHISLYVYYLQINV